jgi:excisionase family DNA binding protein
MGYKPSTAEPLLVTAGDAAQMLHVSVAQVWLWVKDGVLPHVRVGKMMRLRVVDINEFIAEHLTTDWQAHRRQDDEVSVPV